MKSFRSDCLRSPRATFSANTFRRHSSDVATVMATPTGLLISCATPATRRPSAACFSDSISELWVLQMAQRSLGRVPGFAYLLLVALALGDLLRCDVDADDAAVRTTQWMPIGYPGSLLVLTGPLSRDLNAGHGSTGVDDRTDDTLDRICQGRHALPDGAADMIRNWDATYLGEPLVDLQVTAIGRQNRKADRRGVVDELQGRGRLLDNRVGI